MNLDNWWLNALWSVVPTICLGLAFWFIIRSVMHADRNERRAYARIEQEERAKWPGASVDPAPLTTSRPLAASQRGAARGLPPAGHLPPRPEVGGSQGEEDHDD